MPRLSDEDATRRRLLKGGLVLVGSAVAGGSARAGDSDGAGNHSAQQPEFVKFTPEAVSYQPTPKGWQKCLFCTYFREPGTCGIVAGTVSAEGWCTHFALLHE